MSSVRCVLTTTPDGRPLAGIDIELVRTDTMAIIQVVQTNKAGQASFTTMPPAPFFFRPRIIRKDWNLQTTGFGYGRSIYDRVVDPAGLGTDLTITSAIANLPGAYGGGSIGVCSGAYPEGAPLVIPANAHIVIEGIGHGIVEDATQIPVMNVKIQNPSGAGGFNGYVFTLAGGAQLTLRGVEVYQNRAYDAIHGGTNLSVVLEDAYVHCGQTVGHAFSSNYAIRIHRSVVTTKDDVFDALTSVTATESRLTSSAGHTWNGPFGECIFEKCAMTDFLCSSTVISTSLRLDNCALGAISIESQATSIYIRGCKQNTGGTIISGYGLTDITLIANEFTTLIVGHYNPPILPTNQITNIVVGNNRFSEVLGVTTGDPAVGWYYASCIFVGYTYGVTFTGNEGKTPAGLDDLPVYLVNTLEAGGNPLGTHQTTGTIVSGAFAGNTHDGNMTATYGPGIPLSMIGGSGATTLLDGVYHTDTLLGNVLDGDMIIGNVTPKWSRLGITIPGGAALMNVFSVVNGELRGSWKAVLDATDPAGVALTAAPGTSLVFAHRDHVHAHTALSGDLHTDYLLAAGTRALTGNWNPGAFIIGNFDFTAKPTALYVGDANFKLSIAANGPRMDCDSGGGDYFEYYRAFDAFRFVMGSTVAARLTTTGLAILTGALPAYPLDIAGQAKITAEVGLGGNPSAGIGVYLRGTYTAAGSVYGLYTNVTLAPATGNEAHVVSLGGAVSVANGVTCDIGSSLKINPLTKSGAGTVTSAYGIYIFDPPTAGTTRNKSMFVSGPCFFTNSRASLSILDWIYELGVEYYDTSTVAAGVVSDLSTLLRVAPGAHSATTFSCLRLEARTEGAFNFTDSTYGLLGVVGLVRHMGTGVLTAGGAIVCDFSVHDTGNVTEFYGVRVTPCYINSTGTLGLLTGIKIDDLSAKGPGSPGAGSITSAIGIDIAAFATGGGTKYGIRNASALLQSGTAQFTGALQVDVISEYTATVGVTADGVTMKDARLLLTEVTEPVAVANTVLLYAKDKAGVSALYFKQDDGTEVEVGAGGGGGDVATDAIWDTKGDLAVGTGADAANNLPAGAASDILVPDSGEAMGMRWASHFERQYRSYRG